LRPAPLGWARRSPRRRIGGSVPPPSPLHPPPRSLLDSGRGTGCRRGRTMGGTSGAWMREVISSRPCGAPPPPVTATPYGGRVSPLPPTGADQVARCVRRGCPRGGPAAVDHRARPLGARRAGPAGTRRAGGGAARGRVPPLRGGHPQPARSLALAVL